MEPGEFVRLRQLRCARAMGAVDKVTGGGFGSEGDQVTPTRVTTLTIEVIQHGTIRTTLTVRAPGLSPGRTAGRTDPPAAATSPAPMVPPATRIGSVRRIGQEVGA